jgi:hypothetical protein
MTGVGTPIGSVSDFMNWGGNGYAYLTNSFTLTTFDTPFAIVDSIWFNASGYTITVDTTSTFRGLFSIERNVIPTIQNLILNISANTVQQISGQCGFILSEPYNDGTTYYNPQANFVWCSVSIAGVMSNNFTGGYVGAYHPDYTGTLSFTQCGVYIQEQSGYGTGGFMASSLLNTDPLPTGTRRFSVTFTKCFSQCLSFNAIEASCFCGNINSVNVTADQCIANVNFNQTEKMSAYGYLNTNVQYIITDSYTVYSSANNATSGDESTFIFYPSMTCYLNDKFSTLSVTSFYGQRRNESPLSTGYASDYNYNGRTTATTNADGSYGVTYNKCAFPGYTRFKRTYNHTATSTIYNYGITTSTSNSPFSAFDLTNKWYRYANSTSTPLVLRAYIQSPYSNYTYYDTSVQSTPCVLHGTKIVRFDGTLAEVQHLVIGDELRAFNGNTTRIRNINVAYSTENPVCIPQGFFTENIPNEDLYLSPWHAIIHPVTQKWVHAQHLKHFRDHAKRPSMYMYYMIQTTDESDVICTNGVWSETFGSSYVWDCSVEEETCRKCHVSKNPTTMYALSSRDNAQEIIP